MNDFSNLVQCFSALTEIYEFSALFCCSSNSPLFLNVKPALHSWDKPYFNCDVLFFLHISVHYWFSLLMLY